jgi:pimeloyl-ACP methyl ester carboxylesterase
MSCVRNVLLYLLGSLTIFANLACVAIDAPPTASIRTTRVDLQPCHFPNHKSELLCGKYPVFEDRAAKAGRIIPLNIVVLPAITAQPKPDPVFFLSGGPGQGAARAASAREDPLMRELRRERDLIFIDLRGTGDSKRLQCSVASDQTSAENYLAEIFPLERIHVCRETLAGIADLRFYTTPIAMDDFEEVRAALGYGKINLYAVSYGTQAALQYLRLYSARVRSAALAGVTTPAAKLPLHFAKAAQQAMDRLIDDCAADTTCANQFPNLKGNFASVLAAFDKGPVTFEFIHPVMKTAQPVSLSRGVFVERLRLLLYDHSTARLIPLLIHQAATGDWTAFAKIALAPSAVASGIALGMYLSVTCSESVPLISEHEIVHETQGTFLGEYRTRRHQQACSEWPRGEVSPEYYRPAKSEVPVLMLSGEIDPATPPAYGKAASQFLSNSRQILLRRTPHNYQLDCATYLTAEFIAKGSAKHLDTTCADHIRRPRFLTELPERYNR